MALQNNTNNHTEIKPSTCGPQVHINVMIVHSKSKVKPKNQELKHC